MAIQVIREQRISYDERGLADVEDDLYIKLDSTLTEWLKTLQGAKLSTFLFIALNEARVCAGKAKPVTRKQIVIGTGYKERAVMYAVQWLEENEFITQAEPSAKGEKTYRPKAFAWFGRGAKNAPPGTVQPDAPPANRAPLQSYDDDVHLSSSSDESTSSSIMHARMQTLASGGCEGINVEWFAERLDDQQAQTLADWCKQNPDGKRNPWGYAYFWVKDHPHSLPPGIQKPPERKRHGRFHLSPERASALGLVEDPESPGWYVTPSPTVSDIARLALDIGPDSLAWKQFREEHGVSPDEFIHGTSRDVPSRDNSAMKEE